MMTLMTESELLAQIESKYLASIPEIDRNSPERMFIHIEEAYWNYIDFEAVKYSHLPRFNDIRSFSKALLNQSESLQHFSYDFCHTFNSYQRHKSTVPVCGAILLSQDGKKVLLVRDFNSLSWTFPRGKLNFDECPLECAIREVTEEIGFDIRSRIDSNNFLISKDMKKSIQLYIIPNISEDTKFQIQTHNEISGIKFFSINNLPQNTFHVRQFIPSLLKWIERNKISIEPSLVDVSSMESLVEVKRSFHFFDLPFQWNVANIMEAVDDELARCG
mmetsp:Transcript_6456/g.9670  ORF Transcript_6456/g.9670 Transcript_6456/m.9670 type:complete len:275 (+) Transcript_6456:3-827(+)